MNLILQMLLSATSMRCAARIIDIISNVLQIPTQAPSWYTARIWLLRLGYYKLMRPKVISDDWIWIVDHSVQLGTEKCLLILGIRQKDLPVGRALTYSDVEPIELIPSVKSNGKIVYEQLTIATAKTGVPAAIVSDAGPDLNAGINLFIQNNIETRRIYDVKHMVALVLKKVLTADEAWIEFIDKASNAKL